jgi:streptogramin lyase
MSQDFVTALQLQLREAALREERRTPLRRALAPRPVLAGAAAVALVALVVAVGGLRWGDREERQAAPRVVSNVKLSSSLGQVAGGFGAGWVIDEAKSSVLRVDPRTRRVEATIRTGEPILVGAGAGSVWVLEGDGTLARIDPRTNRVAGRTPILEELMRRGVEASLPFMISFEDGVPWVETDRGALRLDPATGAVAGFIPLRAEGARAVALGADGFWVLTRDARLLRFDLDDGRLSADLPVRLQDASGVVPTAAGPVLVTADGRIARASLTDGELAWSRQASAGYTAPGIAIGDVLWLHSIGDASPDRMIAFDLETGATRASVRLPEFGAEGVARVGGELWVASPTGQLMAIRR